MLFMIRENQLPQVTELHQAKRIIIQKVLDHLKNKLCARIYPKLTHYYHIITWRKISNKILKLVNQDISPLEPVSLRPWYLLTKHFYSRVTSLLDDRMRLKILLQPENLPLPALFVLFDNYFYKGYTHFHMITSISRISRYMTS